jgi:hypothetical protein
MSSYDPQWVYQPHFCLRVFPSKWGNARPRRCKHVGNGWSNSECVEGANISLLPNSVRKMRYYEFEMYIDQSILLCNLATVGIHALTSDNENQRNLVRGYTVDHHEMHTGKKVKQIMLRAGQLAESEPQLLCCSITSRVCIEEEISSYKVNSRKKPSPGCTVCPHKSSVEEIGNALLAAQSQVVTTT